MPSIETKKSIYRDSRANVALNKRQWGRLFALGNQVNTDQVVSHKENPNKPAKGNSSKGVNMPEALASQLLVFLYKTGFDIANIEFDANGRIICIPSLSK